MRHSGAVLLTCMCVVLLVAVAQRDQRCSGLLTQLWDDGTVDNEGAGHFMPHFAPGPAGDAEAHNSTEAEVLSDQYIRICPIIPALLLTRSVTPFVCTSSEPSVPPRQILCGSTLCRQ